MEQGRVSERTPIVVRSDRSEIHVRRVGEGSFVWPPIPDAPASPNIQEETDQSQKSALASLIDSIEITLLGRTALSFARRADEECWSPDTLGDYCWRCGGSVGLHETDGDGCASCRNTKLHWDQAIRLGQHQGIVRDAVLELKFKRWRTSGRELGRSMGHAIKDRMERIGLERSELLLVPIPVSWRRRVKRGVDHTRILAQGAAGVIGCRHAQILRAEHRPEQVGLSMSARGRNIKGSFQVRKKAFERLDDRIRAIVLVDDVRTTGATMTAACKALRKAGAAENGAEIWVSTAGVAALGARDRRGLKNSGSGGADF